MAEVYDEEVISGLKEKLMSIVSEFKGDFTEVEIMKQIMCEGELLLATFNVYYEKPRLIGQCRELFQSNLDICGAAVCNEETEEVLIYAVNRSLDEAMELDVSLEGFESVKPLEHTELYSDDLKAVNDKETERVSARSVAVEENAPVMLKKHSWNMLRYKVGK